jgi:hypothetical protein
LNNADIPDDRAYEFLKRLSAAIFCLKDASIRYDEIKPLSGFLWQIFAGWDFISGYKKEDVIKEMIDSI